MKTPIAVLYPNRLDAQAAMASLLAAGFPAADISLLSNRALDAVEPAEVTSPPGTELVRGAGAGIAGGAVGATLASIALAAVPGIGWLLAAGPIASALAAGTVGAVAGGLGGALAGTLRAADIDELDAHIYHEAVRRGGSVVVVAVPPLLRSKATTVLLQHRPVSIDQVAQEWRTRGWDPTQLETRPYDGASLDAERARFEANRWSPHDAASRERHQRIQSRGGPATTIRRDPFTDTYRP